MSFVDQRLDLTISRHIHALVDQPHFRMAGSHLPAAILLSQFEVDNPKMVTRNPRHDGRHTGNPALGIINLSDIRILARESLVGMAQQQSVNPYHLRQINRGVLHKGLLRRPRDTGVSHYDHQIGPFGTHLGDVVLSRLDHIGYDHLAFQITAIPLHDLGWIHPQNPYLDRLHVAIDVLHLTVEQHIRLEAVGHSIPVDLAIVVAFEIAGIEHVGIQDRIIGPRQCIGQIVEAVVELVVTEVADVILQLVERIDGGMAQLFQVIRIVLVLRKHVIRQRRALDQVTIIDQQVVAIFLTGFMDQQRSTGEPERVVDLVLVVVKTKQIGVNIGGLDQTQIDISGGGFSIIAIATEEQQQYGYRAQREGRLHWNCHELFLTLCCVYR